MTKRTRFATLVAVLAMLGSMLSLGTARADADGSWSAPFSPFGEFDAAPPATIAQSQKYPAAASAVVLPSGQILYWNGLQNLENCSEFALATNAGNCQGDGVKDNSVSQILDLTGTGSPSFYTVPTDMNSDDLFCADQRLLVDGRVVAAGGTHWAQEIPSPVPGEVHPNGPGLAELYGSKNTHLFSLGQNTGSWTTASDMGYGRWYPSMLTQPDGKLFIAGGVSKLLWNSSNFEPVDGYSGQQPYPQNVKETETFNPADGSWADNGRSADVALPLFARIHALPNGEILYTGVGQMWGPAGESVDQLEWNNRKIYNPTTKTWRDDGLAAFGARSGAFSAMLPLRPDGAGNYNTAQFVLGGGTLGTSPGGEVATNLSELVSATMTGGFASTATTTTERTGVMANPRWYSSAVTLPNGQVLAFNGANIDEVVWPGYETAVRQAELFDPATNTWTALESGRRDRTYHNSALLLPDGSVLVGGHAPINANYAGRGTENNSFGNNLKDPSFERFYPPYLDGPRPKIAFADAAQTWGGTLNVTLASGSATKIVLSRLPSVTHTTDADNRTIELSNFSVAGLSLSAKVPNSNVAPPGYYYVFAVGSGGTPSVASIVKIGASVGGIATPVNLITQ